MAARAVWQRSANRYLVQEDAKRAPKLASSSLLSKSDTATVADVTHDFTPLNHNSSYQTTQQINTLETHQHVTSMSNKSYEFVDMDSLHLPWWQMPEKHDFTSLVSNNLIDKYDLPKPMHTRSVSNPQMIKCSHTAIPQLLEGENVTSKPPIDSSKPKILEALCHSQTRARKAEIAAKEAYAEKEHAINLLFRQASQLFAYRQWVYLLQLENLCYQMKDNNNCTSMLSKNVKLPKNLNKVTSAKGKRTRTRRGVERHEHDITKYAVVFFVGLGIVGAGLLLGWTVGWMLI